MEAPERLINLTRRQVQYLMDESHRFYVNSAGRRARKTLITMRKIEYGPRGAVMNEDHRFFLGAPTRRQAKRIFWERLKKDTKSVWAKKPNESELYVTLLSKSRIYIEGLDKPERIEGSPWNGCQITEFAKVKEHAFTESVLPAISDTDGFAYLDSVPKGRNHYYDHALYACGGVIPETIPIVGARGTNPDDPEWVYYHWFSSDVLSMTAIAQLKMNMDDRTYRQEMEGQFVGYEGLAYYSFSESNLDINLQQCKGEHIHIGMDFNLNPMTASLSHIRGDEILQWGEIYLNHSNTFEMRDYLLERYPTDLVTIYPDATGAYGTSNATRSDIAILRSAGFVVKARPQNPLEKDRVSAVNCKMMTTDGKVHWRVNPKNCPKTVNDCNKVECFDDGRLNKEQEKKGLKHMMDNVGYKIAYNFPIQRTIATSMKI